MKRSFVRSTFTLAVLLIVTAAHAEQVWEYRPGYKCRMGGDIRLRLEHYDRDALNPENQTTGNPRQYFRMRTRLYGCLDLWEGAVLYGRLVNHWRHYSSLEGRSNGPYHYDFPDEVIFDQLYVDFLNIADSGWDLRLGRQNLLLGTGFLVLEGTPLDASRTLYFDGAVAQRTSETDDVKVFAFYNNVMDEHLPVINDQHRALRTGDQLVAGASWTHRFDERFSSQLYGFHIDNDDDVAGNTGLAPGMPGNTNDNFELDTLSLRVFGAFRNGTTYSAELAGQRGDLNDEADFTGTAADVRLSVPLPWYEETNPKLSFRYTYMSGDDRSSLDEMEGFYPVLAGYPMFREEITIFHFRDNSGVPAFYRNLHRFETRLGLKLAEKVNASLAWACLRAPEQNNRTFFGTGGDGDRYGQTLYTEVNYTPAKVLQFRAQIAGFFAGDYYQDGQNGEWVRLEAVYRF